MGDSDARQRRAAVQQLVVASILLAVQLLVFVVAAGEMPGVRAWIYFAAALLHYVVSTVVQYAVNPELLVHRLKLRRVGSKRWDELVMRVSNLMVIVAIPIVAGMDLGRYQWTALDASYTVVGIGLLGLSTLLLNWAMAVNPHFEPTVRIQTDRGHRVITTGPYQLVRHPGYLAGLLFAQSMPMILGSVAALLPAGVYCLLMMLRTWLEDQTLHRELPGYAEYAQRTIHRLIPGVW
jgi:protein-S-isoprenylcysteine O-methyltransferase Ste14